MMKKRYMAPESLLVETELLTMVCTSGGVKGKGTGGDIGYGGVDDEGKKDPSVRRYDVWEEEDEEV